ncbi:LysR family transcriptional regulator [Aeromicrobium sp.]|uniref:LysR family transcriptional regulator n=1 Tax=Aeromicrobium sp. TaxID=1871063 RepID=UPI0030C090F4
MDLLRHLRFFTAVAEARHFGDAARDIGMTQPPLSQGIKRLEDRLSVRLFDRDSRGVRVTSAGQSLLPAARELLRLEGELFERASELELPRHARVGLAGDLEDLIPHVVDVVVKAGLAMVPTLAGSVDLVDLLHEGELDVAVVRHPGVLDGLSGGPALVIPTRLVSLGDRVSALSNLLPVAVPPRHHQPAAHDQLVDALRRLGHSGRVVESPDYDQRRAMAAAGTACRLAPELNGAGHDQQLPPLRLRVAVPLATGRRPEVDHDAVVAALHQALTP